MTQFMVNSAKGNIFAEVVGTELVLTQHDVKNGEIRIPKKFWKSFARKVKSISNESTGVQYTAEINGSLLAVEFYPNATSIMKFNDVVFDIPKYAPLYNFIRAL